MRRTADYHFSLPSELIAQAPAAQRDASRLLAVKDGQRSDLQFSQFLEQIPGDAVVIVNDTKVIRARLKTRKASGGAVELLLFEPSSNPRQWRCLAKASKAIVEGSELEIIGTALHCKVVAGRAADGSIVVEFPVEVFELLEQHGELPLPPYIQRPQGDTPADRARYQTVFSRSPGAVAAPTAGLHFTEAMLESMDERGVERASVTLHVGLGTFAPVRVDELSEIELHEERYEIPERTAELIASGRPIVAVGTTVVRALESAALGPRQVRPGPGRTSIFISPGYTFQIPDMLLTNFHLPESTLLMLVSAFAGFETIKCAYEHAVAERYRFFSYGDAMLLSRED